MCAHAGFLLGSRETLLETKDGGRTWEPRSVAAAKDEGDSVLRFFPPGSCMPLLGNCQAGRMAEVQKGMDGAQISAIQTAMLV